MIPCFYLYYLVHCGSRPRRPVARSRAYVLRMIPYTRHPSRTTRQSFSFFFSSLIPNDPRPVLQSNVSFDDLSLLRVHMNVRSRELFLRLCPSPSSLAATALRRRSVRERQRRVVLLFSHLRFSNVASATNACCYVDSSSRALFGPRFAAGSAGFLYRWLNFPSVDGRGR